LFEALKVLEVMEAEVQRALPQLVRAAAALAGVSADAIATPEDAAAVSRVIAVAAAEALLNASFESVEQALAALKESAEGDVLADLLLVSSAAVESGVPLDCALLLDALLRCAEEWGHLEREGGDAAGALSLIEQAEALDAAADGGGGEAEEELLGALAEVTALLAALQAEEGADPPPPPRPPPPVWRPATARSRPASAPRERPLVSAPEAGSRPPLPPPPARSSFSSVHSYREAQRRAARVAAARAVYAAARALGLPPPPRAPPPLAPKPPPPKRCSLLELLPYRTHGSAPRPRSAPPPPARKSRRDQEG